MDRNNLEEGNKEKNSISIAWAPGICYYSLRLTNWPQSESEC